MQERLESQNNFESGYIEFLSQLQSIDSETEVNKYLISLYSDGIVLDIDPITHVPSIRFIINDYQTFYNLSKYIGLNINEAIDYTYDVDYFIMTVTKNNNYLTMMKEPSSNGSPLIILNARAHIYVNSIKRGQPQYWKSLVGDILEPDHRRKKK